jgi:hypothetical protein
MGRDDVIIQAGQPDRKGCTQPITSLNGLLDLLDVLTPDLEQQGGLVSVFAVALREELEEAVDDGRF